MMNQDLVATIKRLEREIETLKAQEFGSIRDPLWALSKADSYIRTIKGGRGWFPNYNQNEIDNQLLDMQLSNNPSVYRDATRHFSYWLSNPTGTKYLYNAGGAWNVDANVYNWNTTPGLFVATWVNHQSYFTSSLNSGIFSNWDASASNRVWRIQNIHTPAIVSGNDRPRFDVSSNGTSTQGICEIEYTPATGTWVFYAAKWVPSSRTKIWLFDGDDVYTAENTTSIPATLHTPGSPTTRWGSFLNALSAQQVAHAYLNGAIFAVNAINDSEVELIYEITRNIYGV